MIKLDSFFDQLAYGEFLSIDIGGVGCKGIAVEDYAMVATQINLGMLELYKRFDLKMNSLVIQLYADILEYKIHSLYAQSNTNSTEPVKWIVDAGKPYLDDLLQIARVYNMAGVELTLNDPHDVESIWSPQYNVIACPEPDPLQTITVSYRAVPTPVATEGLYPSEVYLDIPPSLIEALLWYVAGRVHTNLNLAGDIGEGNNYTMKFEQSLQKVELLGLINDRKATNLKPELRSWV